MFTLIPPKKALSTAFYKLPVLQSEIDALIQNFSVYLNSAKQGESEEYHKNLIKDFLSATWYAPDYTVNTNGREDLVIYGGNSADSKPAVIIEAKSPSNTAEMFSVEKPNCKALQECVYYFLQESLKFENREIKKIIITNYDEFYIFDAKDFSRFFLSKTNPIVDKFLKFEAKQLSDTKTSYFYENCAKPAIEKWSETETVEVTHFSKDDFAPYVQGGTENEKLIPLYKILSPEHLLQKPFANDSNSLDRNFYAELLHIIGLEEVKDGGKKLICRKKAGSRDSASLLESAIYQLEEVIPGEEKCFETALHLCITWVNRLLFLKLVESQQLSYQKGNADYKFLTSSLVPDFDELNVLFFKVLGRKTEERDSEVKEKYRFVPYLNSSLFEISEEELEYGLQIRGIKNKPLSLYKNTVLKDEKGRRLTGEMDNLAYIFKFLDAYNFSSEGSLCVSQSSKTLINASVLGLIFEKINGYKDGSFFTPGFITEYMAKETIERAVVQKFNEKKGWACRTLDDVADRIEDYAEANAIINSVRICDPAVGSGHFLVSALNRLLFIKSYLNCLFDKDGRRIKKSDWELKLENDEISVLDEDGNPFSYSTNTERQRVQEALFAEKREIIENCLFGADINPTSVSICRLRLWIELLKNAYYTKESGFTQLDTLPNIDINIKCGNSLVSRYAVRTGSSVSAQVQDDETKSKEFKSLVARYKKAVSDYKNESNKANKREVDRLIKDIKGRIRSVVQLDLFDEELNKKAVAQDVYKGSLEWMIEFPELLDDDGSFLGFDAVIGNPPYVQLQSMGSMSEAYSKLGYEVYNKSADLYCLFAERGYSLLKKDGLLSLIMPNKWMLVDYGKELRHFFAKTAMRQIVNFGDVQFFHDAATIVCIFVTQKSDEKSAVRAASFNQKTYHGNFLKEVPAALQDFSAETFGEEPWIIRPAIHTKILEKMKAHGKALKDLPIEINYGIKTGFNDAFFIDGETKKRLVAEDAKSAELIQPLFRGRDITAWHTENADLYLINPHNGDKEKGIPPVNIEEYPALKKHLDQFIEKLKKRGDKGDTPYNLRNCAYLDEFSKPKIVYPNMTSLFPFCYDESGTLTNQKCFIITAKDARFPLKALLAVLNSKLAKLWIWYNCPELQGGTREISKAYFENFPVPKLSQENAATVQELRELAEKILAIKRCHAELVSASQPPKQVRGDNTSALPVADTSALEREIDAAVYKLYGLTEEEIAVVEHAMSV